MARVYGDFPKLNKIIMDMAKSAGGAFLPVALKRVGEVAYDLAVKGANAGVNPMGRKWRARKVDKSRALANIGPSLFLEAQALLMKIESREPWANYHQKGARRRPKTLARFGARLLRFMGVQIDKKERPAWRLPVRRILPSRAIPKPWYGPMLDAANKAFTDFFEQG